MRWLLAICILLVALPAWGHDTLTSSVVVDVRSDAIDAEISLPLDQLQMAGVWPVSRPDMERYVAGHFSVQDAHGSVFELRTLDQKVDAQFLVLALTLDAPPGADMSSLKIFDNMILHRVVSHRILVSTRRDFALGSYDTKLAGVITFADSTVAIDRTKASAFRGLGGMFALGAKHIADGTDHLLFLLVLLLGSALTIRSTFKIVTAFTIGHSISLALATLGWIALPSKPVEVAVALSIVVTAIHAIRPIVRGNEPAIAGFFGLVHGFAFATALREFGFEGTDLGLSLLGFNLGIEAMQLGVVIAFLPWLVMLSRTDLHRRFRIGIASLAGVAAIGWAAERVMGRPNAVTRTTAAVASHPWLLLGALAAFAIAATVGPWIGRPLVRHS